MNEIISYGYIENKLMYPHRNQGMEIVLVDKGHLEWAVDRVPEILNPGTVFFTLPWQTHGSLMLREPSNHIYYTLFTLPEWETSERDCLHFPEFLKLENEEACTLSRIFTGAQRHAWPSTPLLRELFPELIRRLDQSSTLETLATASLFKALLVELANIIHTAQKEPKWLSPRVQRVKNFLPQLLELLGDPWTLDAMAAQCGVKRTQFAHITKRLTGYAPIQYLQRIRLDKSCELLRHTDRSITDIAFDCGYSSSQYFSETFKNQTHMTPSEYRQSIPALDAMMQENWDHPEWRTLAEERRRVNLLSGHGSGSADDA